MLSGQDLTPAEFKTKWQVKHGSEHYPFWIKMLNQLEEDFKQGYFLKNIDKIREQFGMPKPVTSNRLSREYNDPPVEVSPLKRHQLEAELEIWTKKNVITFFNSFLVAHALTLPPNSDYKETMRTDTKHLKDSLHFVLCDVIQAKRKQESLARFYAEDDALLTQAFSHACAISLFSINNLNEAIKNKLLEKIDHIKSELANLNDPDHETIQATFNKIAAAETLPEENQKKVLTILKTFLPESYQKRHSGYNKFKDAMPILTYTDECEIKTITDRFIKNGETLAREFDSEYSRKLYRDGVHELKLNESGTYSFHRVKKSDASLTTSLSTNSNESLPDLSTATLLNNSSVSLPDLSTVTPPKPKSKKSTSPGFFSRHWVTIVAGGLLLAGIAAASVFTLGILPALSLPIMVAIYAGVAISGFTIGACITAGIAKLCSPQPDTCKTLPDKQPSPPTTPKSTYQSLANLGIVDFEKKPIPISCDPSPTPPSAPPVPALVEPPSLPLRLTTPST